jgi:hypothetical protein
MAIIYSYPKSNQVYGSDCLIISRIESEASNKGSTLNIDVDALKAYINADGANTLDQVLNAGNISIIPAKIGDLYLYNENDVSGNGYVYITGNKNRFNFYNNADVHYANISQDSLVLVDTVVPSREFQINKPVITANRIATFQDASGTIAYLSDIASLPQGLYAQYEDSIYIEETTSEESLIGEGMGTLSVPADTFAKGDSFQANLMGKISCANAEELHIRIKTATGVMLVDTGVMTLGACTDKCWKLDLNFTIRSNGGTGSASIASGGLFSYVKNAGTNFEGICFNFINNTTFDTTVDNELEVTAQWGTANASNKIFSQIFTLNKIF